MGGAVWEEEVAEVVKLERRRRGREGWEDREVIEVRGGEVRSRQ